MLDWKTYTCVKCGKPFTKAVGGFVMSPEQMKLELQPICDRCKANTIFSIFKSL